MKEVVRFLRFQHHIKFWIITGDKDQTVVRIAR